MPTSSISSTASAIVFTIDQFSIPSRWNGSSAIRSPSALGLGADLAQAVDDHAPRRVAVAPGR